MQNAWSDARHLNCMLGRVAHQLLQVTAGRNASFRDAATGAHPQRLCQQEFEERWYISAWAASAPGSIF